MTKKAQGKVAANSKRWSILQVSRVSTRGSPPASRGVSPFVVGGDARSVSDAFLLECVVFVV